MRKTHTHTKDLRPLPRFDNCFVCGGQNPRGLNLPFFGDDDGVTAEFTPDKSLAGYEDTMHGGIISTVLDEAVIWAAFNATGRYGVTAELTVRFKKPVIVERTYIITGRLTDDMSRMWKAEAQLTDESGKVFASAVGKIMPAKD